MLDSLYREHGELVIEHYTVAPLSKKKNTRLLKIRRKLNRWEEIRRRTYILGHPECLQNVLLKMQEMAKELNIIIEELK